MSNSDYSKKRTDLYKLLPEVNQSDVNKSVFENLFNRYLSKEETRVVDGYVGQGNPNALINRQLVEPTPDRQAYQLQPLLYTKIGTVEHLSTFKDIMNEAERLGIDIEEQYPEWVNSVRFNWMPPINIDKLLNYRDYYWVPNDTDVVKLPQYITIENVCQQAEARVDQYETQLTLYGDEFTILGISAVDNQFIISGNLVDVFTNDFPMYIKDSTNATINNKYYTAVSSEYDTDLIQTIITVSEDITNDIIVDGIISLNEFLGILQSGRDCACTGTSGWGGTLWDDNQLSDVLWNTQLLINITSATPLPGPALYDIWYDTTTNELKQWDGISWVAVQGNFSSLIALTEGTHLFGLSEGCGVVSEGTDDWSEQNRWVHRNHVKNFTTVKQAQIPIIEFKDTLEINEWSCVEHSWKYRTDTIASFEEVTIEPSLFELLDGAGYSHPTTSQVVLDQSYGDLTNTFVPGYTFQIVSATNNNGIYTVKWSNFKEITTGVRYQTEIEIEEILIDTISDGNVIPLNTSVGDPWIGYNEHWVYVGVSNTTPIDHQSINPLVPIPTSTPPVANATYDYTLGLYAQSYFVTVLEDTFVLDATLQNALLGTNNVRIYVNDVRQYGTYIETGSPFVDSIILSSQAAISDVVRIEVGPAAISDIGRESMDVRMEEDNAQFLIDGIVQVGLIQYKKAEQLKSQLNQYPLFDIHRIDGESKRIVTPIFAYREESTRAINPNINKRIVVLDSGKNYEFEQSLIEEDNGILYAYRDHALRTTSYWFNSETNELLVWDGNAWSNYAWVDDNIIQPVISALSPPTSIVDPGYNQWASIEGMLWFDTTANLLYVGDGLGPMVAWTSVPFADSRIDPTMQTIWKKGLNNEEYIPKYINGSREEVTIGDDSGDWEIADPFYYNSLHENRQVLKLTELTSHFSDIISSQDVPSGFVGSAKEIYHTLDRPNFGLGGTILEHNDSYDTFLSTLYIDNITPISLIEFAQDQYEAMLNNLTESFKRDAVSILTNTTKEYVVDIEQQVTDDIILKYEQQDTASLIYGDSTTYNETTGLGIRNWIATLPYFNLLNKVQPSHVFDSNLNINRITHHDGHKSQISLQTSSEENIIRQTLNTSDVRVGSGDTLGLQKVATIIDTAVPPVDVSTYLTAFGGSTIQKGTYWYRIDNITTPSIPTRTLYRFVVAGTTNAPPTSVVDGTLWYDSTTQLLKRKLGASWIPVTGIVEDIEAAWEIIDISKLAASIILEAETRLFDGAPENTEEFAFDFDTTRLPNPTIYEQYVEESFGEHIKEKEVEQAFSAEGIYKITDPFTWNYINSNVVQDPTGGTNTGNGIGGTWQDLYEKIYGTSYPHLEPWILQGFVGKPTWWDEEYKETNGTRTWIYTHSTTTGMWENVRVGIIPVTGVAPDGEDGTGLPSQVPGFAFVSVNIDDVAYGSFEPDSLLPPYWDHTGFLGLSYTGPIRSLIPSLSNVISPQANYQYGDMGLEEWKYNISSQRIYDELKVAFRIQPVKFIHNTLGIDFVEVAGLQIDRRTEKVYAHQDTIFHGDVINGTETLVADGLLQWYVNNNRYGNYDVGISDFRTKWTNWTPPLAYQFASFVEVPSFDIDNKVFDVTDSDYLVTTKRTPGIEDVWLDTFDITILSAPATSIDYITEDDWNFEINTTSPIGRPMTFYDVHNYPFAVDNNICTLYKNDVVNEDIVNNGFVFEGNQVEYYQPARMFTISNSTGNNGTWEVKASTYNSITKKTLVTVVSGVVVALGGGSSILDYRKLPWETGDIVYASSNGILSSSLVKDQLYFIIKLTNNTFQLARSYTNASNGIPMPVEAGYGQMFIGQVHSTFQALGGGTVADYWRHYTIDKTITKTITPPTNMFGVQQLVNIVDGYDAFIKDQGFDVNKNVDVDETTGRVINWQFETEKFINWAYAQSFVRYSIPDTYEAADVIADNKFAFTGSTPIWSNGQKVKMINSGSELPPPFLYNISYFYVRLSDTEFGLAETKLDAQRGNVLNLSSAGTGSFRIQEVVNRQSLPSKGINPFRNSIWFNNARGIVADIKSGPYKDIRTDQTIYDQHGRSIDFDNLLILREDSLCQIRMRPNVVDDINPISTDPDDALHVAGMHLFLDGYEHVILFNNYSTDSTLIYDPFIGLNTAKFDIQFNRQLDFTLRPNVGGFYLHGNELKRNIEGSVDEMRKYYDTYRVSELNPAIQQARVTVGYDGPKEYLNNININAKSQFVFWKGMIQSKGSVNSVKAFINSRRFVDAKIDEYWAYKIADFGDIRDKKYPELNLFVRDALQDNVKFEFINDGDTPDDNFEGISLLDQDRWFEQPVQKTLLEDNTMLYFEAEVTSVDAAPTTDPAGPNFIYTSDDIFDTVVITWYNLNNTVTLTEGVDYTILNSRIIEFPADPVVYTDIKIYKLNPAKSKLNPAKVIDHKSGVVITEVPLWDPARGHHFHNAISVVELQRTTDPAQYTNALDTSTVTTSHWNAEEVGQTWMDTSVLGYKPYYDNNITPLVNDRIIQWGSMADYAEVKIFQWTESDVPPEEWDALATVEEGNSAIDDQIKKTGRVRRIVVDSLNNVISFEPEEYFGVFGTTLDITNAPIGEDVNIYVNGVFKETLTVNVSNQVILTTPIVDSDIIHAQRLQPTELQITNGDYIYDYPYSVTTTTDTADESDILTYHFWVEQKTVREEGRPVALSEATEELKEIPIPYMIVQKYAAEALGLPNRYTQSIVKGMATIIKDDNRYLLRYTRDFTLRDDLEDGNGVMNIKNAHTEWTLFRQEQPFHIDRTLWDKVTECVAGVKISNTSIRVPSLERELYDATFNTDTRFGLRDEQALGDKDLILSSIIAYLEDPENDFSPTDIDTFFQLFSFDTPENIIEAMDTIYSTFASAHVNRIFFSALFDALSTKNKYPDLFKTSMISLHGIKLFEVGGIYDD